MTFQSGRAKEIMIPKSNRMFMLFIIQSPLKDGGKNNESKNITFIVTNKITKEIGRINVSAFIETLEKLSDINIKIIVKKLSIITVL